MSAEGRREKATFRAQEKLRISMLNDEAPASSIRRLAAYVKVAIPSEIETDWEARKEAARRIAEAAYRRALP